jgi:hypothetical protein
VGKKKRHENTPEEQRLAEELLASAFPEEFAEKAAEIGIITSPQQVVAKRPVQQMHYFAIDGNYGDAAGLTIIDTGDWIETDFDAVEQASDGERPEVARLISDWIQLGRNNAFIESQLLRQGVDVSEYKTSG